MAFWRGETLLAKLPTLITPFNPHNVDCAAYALTLGSEVFVTSDLPDVGGPHDGVKTVLTPGQQVRITPGQFAFLPTYESIEIPNNAVAFISMKARNKFRGLINVSGFHVDPGFKGQLLFSVYNAGPSPVVLAQGMPLFLIWYADLDGVTQELYRGKAKSIDPELISNMSGEVFSPIALKKEMKRLGDKVDKAKDGLLDVSVSIRHLMWAGGIAAAIVIGAFGLLYKEQSDMKRDIAARAMAPSSTVDRQTIPAATSSPDAKKDKKKDNQPR